MEFGAIQCTPAKPDCLFCPLQSQCWAFQHGQVALLPVKSKAKAARTRYFHYFVLRHGEQTYLRERREKDIWQGLYDFALAETDRARAARRRAAAPPGGAGRRPRYQPGSRAQRRLPPRAEPPEAGGALPSADAGHSRCPTATLRDLGLRAYSAAEIEALPKPKLIANYLNQHL